MEWVDALIAVVLASLYIVFYMAGHRRGAYKYTEKHARDLNTRIRDYSCIHGREGAVMRHGRVVHRDCARCKED